MRISWGEVVFKSVFVTVIVTSALALIDREFVGWALTIGLFLGTAVGETSIQAIRRRRTG